VDRGAGRRVAEEIHRALVDAGLVVRDVSRIVVGIGPGGFTGLRIGIATALALGQALRVPVVGVSTLEALALGMAGDVPDGGLLVPVIDAKRQEVFTAAYRAAGDGGLEVVAEPRAATVSGMGELLGAAASAGDPAWLAGDGLPRCAELTGPAARPLPPECPSHLVSAVQLVRRADAGGALPVAPIYLRLPDAEVNRLRRMSEAAHA
jgi:tRNA threonylcarbamoyl adenosine modification protein YeaZ